jgi:hypothetical protein
MTSTQKHFNKLNRMAWQNPNGRDARSIFQVLVCSICFHIFQHAAPTWANLQLPNGMLRNSQEIPDAYWKVALGFGLMAHVELTRSLESFWVSTWFSNPDALVERQLLETTVLVLGD